MFYFWIGSLGEVKKECESGRILLSAGNHGCNGQASLALRGRRCFNVSGLIQLDQGFSPPGGFIRLHFGVVELSEALGCAP